MAFLLKNLHFLGRKSAFSTFCPQFCGKPNAKKTRVKSVKIFTKHTFYRYVWRGQNHCLAREKVRPREGKIPTTWHRKNLEFANFDIFIPEMNSIFSCHALVQSQISASYRDLCCPFPLTDPETSSGWRWWSIVGLWSSITSFWIWFSISPRAFAAMGINWKMEYEKHKKVLKNSSVSPFLQWIFNFSATKKRFINNSYSRRTDFYNIFVYLRNFSK